MEILNTFTQMPILLALTVLVVFMVVAKVIKKVIGFVMSIAALGMMLLQWLN